MAFYRWSLEKRPLDYVSGNVEASSDREAKREADIDSGVGILWKGRRWRKHGYSSGKHAWRKYKSDGRGAPFPNIELWRYSDE